ncbi:c-type cytochrome [Arenibacterium sp. CAU 1754]
MKRVVATLIAGLLAGPVLAEGDAAKGENGFKKCKSCHTIASDSGETIVKGGKTGPNLYGLVGRTAGSVEGFKYSGDLVAAGEAGLVWDAETFAEYVENPAGFLKEYLDDTKAKSKMSFKLKKGADDIYAYLVSVSPAATE